VNVADSGGTPAIGNQASQAEPAPTRPNATLDGDQTGSRVTRAPELRSRSRKSKSAPALPVAQGWVSNGVVELPEADETKGQDSIRDDTVCAAPRPPAGEVPSWGGEQSGATGHMEDSKERCGRFLTAIRDYVDEAQCWDAKQRLRLLKEGLSLLETLAR